MYRPDYEGGGIVNLMSSIKSALGGSSHYNPLADFDGSALAGRNIVLLVIDGMGYDFLEKYGSGSFLHRNVDRRLTSVFPPTTAAAITTLFTGVAPQQHALTGWFMYLREIGMVTTILPFTTRAGRLPLDEGNIDYRDIYGEWSFFDDIDAVPYSISRRDYFDSGFSRSAARGATRLPYSSLDGLFQQVTKALGGTGGRKYVFAYWPELDSLCHAHGTDSREVAGHFRELDGKLEKFAATLRKRNTVLIVTADHGLIDVDERKTIRLKDHPDLAATLAMPLSGEARVAYCYVRPRMVDRFEDYVQTAFADTCTMHRSEDMVKDGWFGLFEPNKKLLDRIGDYVLVMKENYILKDLLPGERQHVITGYHGGVSSEEMFVPLIVIE